MQVSRRRACAVTAHIRTMRHSGRDAQSSARRKPTRLRDDRAETGGLLSATAKRWGLRLQAEIRLHVKCSPVNRGMMMRLKGDGIDEERFRRRVDFAVNDNESTALDEVITLSRKLLMWDRAPAGRAVSVDRLMEIR
jgi:hypothetical protein